MLPFVPRDDDAEVEGVRAAHRSTNARAEAKEVAARHLPAPPRSSRISLTGVEVFSYAPALRTTRRQTLAHDERRAVRLVRDPLTDRAESLEPMEAAAPDNDEIGVCRRRDEGRHWLVR